MSQLFMGPREARKSPDVTVETELSLNLSTITDPERYTNENEQA